MKYFNSSFLQGCFSTITLTVALLWGTWAFGNPLRMAEETLTPGALTGKGEKADICWGDYRQIKQVATLELAQNGCGRHHYMIVRYGYDAGNQVITLDTLGKTSNENELIVWYNNYWIEGDSVGEFFLKAYVHDDGCTTEWQPCEGEVAYKVLEKFKPGKIELAPNGRDTVYLKNGKVQVSVKSVELASGGSGEYVYEWLRGVKKIGLSPDLTNYRITAPGYVRLRRRVKDANGCGVAISEGVYELKVYDEFVAGAIDERSGLEYCTIAKAATDTVYASPAQGGSLNYLYQWFIKSGEELISIEGATECDLPLGKVNLVAGQTYTFVRKVKDNTRFTEWTLTEGQQTLRLVGKPEASIYDSEACACNGEIILYYKLLTGEVDMYAITFSPKLAAVIGHADTLAFIGEPRIPNTVTIKNLPALPAELPAGEYYMDVKLGASCAAKSLEEVDCYTSTTRVTVVNGLDGYLRQKFELMLLVDNNPDNKIHFKDDYQWYRNGEPVGENKQYFQEADGSKLNGSYFVRLQGTDNKSYRSCSILMMPDEQTALGELLADGVNVYPVPAEAGESVTIRCSRATMTVFTCTGGQVLTMQTADGQTTFAAPPVSGLYYIQLRHEDGSLQTGKLIVK